jgi:hydrogenase maturation protease
MAKSVTVLGVGNILCSDEGVGVHAVRALQSRRECGRPGIEFLDGGTLGLNLLSYIEDANSLILLDAVDFGAPPGTVIELDGEDLPRRAGIKLSEHQLTLQEVLGLARIRGRLPRRLKLIGMQPAEICVGDTLSPAVQAGLERMVERAQAVLGEWEDK